MRVATIVGTLKGIPIVTEVPDENFQRFEAYRKKHKLSVDAAMALVTHDGAVAFTPVTLESFLDKEAPVIERELADQGVAPTA